MADGGMETLIIMTRMALAMAAKQHTPQEINSIVEDLQKDYYAILNQERLRLLTRAQDILVQHLEWPQGWGKSHKPPLLQKSQIKITHTQRLEPSGSGQSP